MKTIYILEDDDGIRELLGFLLESAKFGVRSFPTVRHFENSLPDEVPDLYLLDVMLPDGDGRAVCKSLKENDTTSSIPVILMSAHADINSMEGADDFIPKPFDVDDLISRIEKQLLQ